MLDSCPPGNSCGTYYAIWTDEEAPADIMSLATITAYGAKGGECSTLTLDVQVMRCSLDMEYDLIYRYIGEYRPTCGRAFCGMN